jgi:hypothetical protein
MRGWMPVLGLRPKSDRGLLHKQAMIFIDESDRLQKVKKVRILRYSDLFDFRSWVWLEIKNNS